MADQVKKEKKAPNYIKRIIIFAIVLVVFLFLVNPQWLFFLPQETSNSMSRAWGDFFGGSTEQVTRVVQFNWINILKIVVIVLLLLMINWVIKFILSKINPKSGKGKSLLSMAKSFSTWIISIIGVIWGLAAI